MIKLKWFPTFINKTGADIPIYQQVMFYNTNADGEKERSYLLLHWERGVDSPEPIFFLIMGPEPEYFSANVGAKTTLPQKILTHP